MKKQLQTLLLTAVLAITCGSNTATAQLISAGGSHSIFLCGSKQPMATGANTYGELGDGTTTQRLAPVPLTALSGIIAVSAGLSHSLFLKDDGTVWACGKNTFGELGNGTTSSFSANPVVAQVNSITGVIAVSAGEQHSLFLKSDGTVWACGSNAQGQLGDGTYTARQVPVQVSGVSGIIAISAGHMHSLFLKNDGTVWACGNNGNGQLGEGMTSSDKNTPVQVDNVSGIIAISGGNYHSLFLKNDGTVWGCGSNFGGQLADGTSSQRNSPVQATALSGSFTGISAGNSMSAFIKNDGTVWVGSTSPTQIATLTGITAVSVGGGGANTHALFLKNDGSVSANGINYTGQLGDGTTTNAITPVAPSGLCSVASVNDRNEIEESVFVYPNPSREIMLVELTEYKDVSMQLFDITGQLIWQAALLDVKTPVNIGSLANGMYFLKLAGPAGSTVKKIVKE